MSIKTKVQSLLNAANSKTEKSDTNLTDAVAELIDGYHAGGSPVISPLSVTENGTYTAPTGVDGYSPVTVNVQGGGATEPYREDTMNQSGEVVSTVLHGYTDIPANFLRSSKITTIDLTGIRNIHPFAFSDAEALVLNEIDISGGIQEGAFNSTHVGAKLKIKCSYIGTPQTSTTSGRVFWKCTNLTKVWLSKNISYIYASTSNAQNPFTASSNLTDIYTDAPSKPSGWQSNFNLISTGTYATVHYGVSEAEFDAL